MLDFRRSASSHDAAGNPETVARGPSPRVALLMVALSVTLGGSLSACGGGGHGRRGARGLSPVELERLPVTGPDTKLERVLVTRRTLRVEISPESDTPQWRVIRQLTLSSSQARRLNRDARAVHGWKHKPADTCPGQPK